MKPSSRSPRTPLRFSDSVHHQLNMYALAASAAGVGVLALVRPAEAKIVYTPAHRHVLFDRPLGLDLNRDGVVEFKIRRSTFVFSSVPGTFVSANGVSSDQKGIRNLVAGRGYTGHTTSGASFYYVHADALRDGQQIGHRLNFPTPVGAFMADRWSARRPPCFGLWNNVANRYLGLRFYIDNKAHFGWARLSESCNQNGSFGRGAETLLTGYAYETIPNKPIIAGKTKGPDVITLEPGSLGDLAAGASRLHGAGSK